MGPELAKGGLGQCETGPYTRLGPDESTAGIAREVGMSEAIVASRASLRQLPDYVSALSEARFRKKVEAGWGVSARVR